MINPIFNTGSNKENVAIKKRIRGIKSKDKKSLAVGDSIDKSLFIACMLSSIGYHTYIIFVDLKGDGIYSHAMSAVRLPKPYHPYGSKIIPIESTKTRPLGWHDGNATKVYLVDLEKKKPGVEKYIGECVINTGASYNYELEEDF